MAEAQFQPRWDAKTLRGIISQYKENPNSYPEHYKQTIRQHASYHNVPFYEGEFSITDALTDFGAGFMEGFTTLHFGEESDNEYEAIFKNLGHLAGFAPGIISTPLAAAGRITKVDGLMQAAAMARKLNDKSVPMFAAKHATKFAKKHVTPFIKQGLNAKQGAVSTASNFLLGNRARHIAEGAFHLGAASSVSAWQGGVDEMMSAFVHGGVAGGAFRSIGNFVNTGSEAGSKVARTLAGSLFMGLPSTVQGATTPEQVYNYVMGAWFGGQERPWTIAKAQKFETKYREDSIKDKNLQRLWEPEIHPDFEALPSEVKPIVKENFKKSFLMHQKEMINQYAQEELIKLGVDPEVFKDVAGAQAAIIKAAKDKSLRELIEKESTTEQAEDIEIGQSSVDIIIGKRAENIVNRFTKDIYKDIELEGERTKLKGEVSDKIRALLSEKAKGRQFIYDIFLDMAENPNKKDSTGDFQDIWVYDNPREVELQYQAMLDGAQSRGEKLNYNRPVLQGDHYLIKDTKMIKGQPRGDDKLAYLRGTAPEGIIKDSKGRTKGTKYYVDSETSKENRSEEFTQDLQKMLLKDYKFNLRDDKEGQLAGEIRQLYGRFINDKPLQYLTSNGTDVKFKTSGKTYAGDRKSGKEPAKLVD